MSRRVLGLLFILGMIPSVIGLCWWGINYHYAALTTAYVEAVATNPSAMEMNALYDLCGCAERVVNGEAMTKAQFERLKTCCEIRLLQPCRGR